MDTLYRLIVETANEGVWIKDNDHATTFVNQQMASMLGYTPKDMIGRSYFDFVRPEDHKTVRKKHVTRIEGNSERYEFCFVHKDGSEVWTLINASPLVNDGQFIGSVGMISDITEQKLKEKERQENERRYQSLFENSPIPTWEEDFSQVKLYIDNLKSQGITDLRQYFKKNKDALYECGQLMIVNDINQAVVELNHAPSKKFMLSNFKNLVDSRSMEYAIRQFEAIANGDTSCEFDAELKTFTDEIIHIHLKWTVVKGYENNYKKVYLTTTDLTDRIVAENERLKLSNFQKETLLKEIHHRVKNNLQIIMSLLRLQSNSIEDPEVIKLFELSLHRINAMALVHELLYRSKNFSKINFKVYLNQLLKSLVETMCMPECKLLVDIKAKDIELNINTSISLSLLINEIVTNSIKYGFKGKHEGQIYIHLQQVEGRNYRLEIGDNGSGFELKEDLDSIESLGLQLIFSLTDQLDGQIKKMDKPGTHYVLEFEEQH